MESVRCFCALTISESFDKVAVTDHYYDQLSRADDSALFLFRQKYFFTLA